MSGILAAMMTSGSHGVAVVPDINVNVSSYGSAPISGPIQGNSGAYLHFRRYGDIDVEAFGPLGDTVLTGSAPDKWGFFLGDDGLSTSPLGTWYRIRGFTNSFFGDTAYAQVSSFFNPPYFGSVPIVGQYTRWWNMTNPSFAWAVTAPGKYFGHTGFFEIQAVVDTGTALATKVLPFVCGAQSKP